MAEAAFQRLMTGSKQLTEIVFEEGAAIPGKLVGGNGTLASFKGRREHAEVQLGCDLQHHPAAIPGLDGGGSLLHGPPTRADAIALADLAAARLGGRIFLKQCSFRSGLFFGHIAWLILSR